MNMMIMNLQAPMFGQGTVDLYNQPMGMSNPGPLVYPGQANNNAMGGFRPETRPSRGCRLQKYPI